MSYPPTTFETIEDLKDAILLEMATHRPHLSPSDEAALKSALLAILADDTCWQRHPEEMSQRFFDLMQPVRTGTPISVY